MFDSWLQFFEIVLPFFVLANVLIFLYFSNERKKSGVAEKDIDRFAPRPVGEDDVPSDEDGYIVEVEEGADSNDLLSEIEEEERPSEVEVVEPHVTASDKNESEVGEGFDEVQEDTVFEGEYEELSESEQLYLSGSFSSKCYSEDHTAECSTVTAAEPYVGGEDTGYGDDDMNTLVMESCMALDTSSKKDREGSDLSERLSDAYETVMREKKEGDLSERLYEKASSLIGSDDGEGGGVTNVNLDSYTVGGRAGEDFFGSGEDE